MNQNTKTNLMLAGCAFLVLAIVGAIGFLYWDAYASKGRPASAAHLEALVAECKGLDHGLKSANPTSAEVGLAIDSCKQRQEQVRKDAARVALGLQAKTGEVK